MLQETDPEEAGPEGKGAAGQFADDPGGLMFPPVLFPNGSLRNDTKPMQV